MLYEQSRRTANRIARKKKRKHQNRRVLSIERKFLENETHKTH